MMKMKRLAVITSHPIQYNAPLFKLLSGSDYVTLKVFYTWEQSIAGIKYDPGFGKCIEWDIPLLEGYEYEFIKNTSSRPGSDHFLGLINPDLIKKITAWRPDALLIFGWSFASHLKCLRAFHGKIPIIFRGDSTLLDEQRGFRQIMRRLLLRKIYSYVDVALFTGINNKKYFEKHGLKQEQLFFAPHAVDNGRFSKNASERQEQANQWRKDLGISDEDKVLLFAGKLESKKNPRAMIKLAETLNGNNYKFLFVGNGHLEQELKIAASNDKRIMFLDFQNQVNMPIVYRMADAFVLPSVGPGETWGLAVNEAMACSVPVIVSNKCGCAPDLVQDDVNGYIFDSQNVDEFISKATVLLNKDRNDLKKMGGASFQMINRFSFEAIIIAMENILRNRF